jgi:DNA-directed RNA polymerase specialized sigma24 family protein
MEVSIGEAGRPRAGAGRVRKKDWVLTESAFGRLLTLLDADRDRAAQKYENLRARLIAVFRWRRCLSPEGLADETFDRVSRRLDEGQEIREPIAYFYGVARNVMKEYWTIVQEEKAIEQAPTFRDDVGEASSLDQREREERLQCLEHCMDLLSPESLELITRYYASGADDRTAERSNLASALRVSVGTLRTRAHRARRRLESCVKDCMKRRTDA